MLRFRSAPLLAAAVLAWTSHASAQVNTGQLTENGWFSDDTRADGEGAVAAGTNLISTLLTDAPESGVGVAAHDVEIMRQIAFGAAPGVVPAGTWPGAVHLAIGASGSGKSQISHRKDDGVGHFPGSAMGPAFTAEYSWMGDGTVSVTTSLKFAFKTADFGSTGASSRTGENSWDKVLIYEPGNLNGGTADGLWHTESIDYTTGVWWFFDRTAGAGTIGSPMTLSAMSTSPLVFSPGKSVADVYALITAPGAHCTSVQFGIGSGNAGGSVYVNQLATSAYRPGMVTTFGGGHLVCDADVTNAAIYGSGNANGSFTVARSGGIELGLRGKLRFNAFNLPENTYNSNGNGTYSFEAGAPTAGAGWVNPLTTPFWNIEWSVNTDWDGSSGLALDDLTYELGWDFDAGPGADYLVFDLITPDAVIPFTTPTPAPFWDHSIGTNATLAGGGTEATDQPTYLALLAANNLAQNSWSPEFFNESPFDGFDPHVPGRYEVYLAAKLGGSEVVRTAMTIVVEAPVDFDENVTNAAIFGSGNANGSFTTTRVGGLELGMRGKLREPASNVFNSNGDGTYTFTTGSGTGSFPNSEWSFEWSINTDYDGSEPLRTVGSLTYEIGMDNDPGGGTDYLVFDPVSIGTIIPYTVPAGPIPYWDHSMGDNTTPMGGGVEAGNGVTYASYLALFNLAQNSWRPTFYQNTAPYSWNPNVPGRYDYYLAAFDGGQEIARTSITIIVTDGTTLALEGDACQPDRDCNLPGTQIEVELWARNLASDVSGYQAFLDFDDSAMTFEGSESAYAAGIFTGHVQSMASAEVAPGKLRLDGFTAFGSGDSTDEDELLATLVFTVASECVPVAVTFDLGQPFDSEVSHLGVPLATALIDSSPIVGDGTPPIIGTASDIMVTSDAGSGCASAVVTFSPPGATDNCSAVTVACFPPSGSAFPAGETTTVTCVATDACGNTSTSTFDVTVSATNTVMVDVQLVGVTTATTRCIHFKTEDCGVTLDVSLSFDSTGFFSGPIEIPCGDWTMLCAKDRQHTQWDTSALVVSGPSYATVTTLMLEGGDTDDDGDVDINDVTLFLSQFGLIAANGGCPWDTVTRDSDFDNDGAVGSPDYAFLVANWLTTSSCSCTIPASVDPQRLRGLATVRLADARTAAADLNRDGWIDHRDVALFETRHGLSGELSRAMRESEEAGR